MPSKGKARAARMLKRKEPQVVEGPKYLLAVRGPTTSEIGTTAMKDLAALKKPHCKLLQRKNDIRPFEDVSSIEFLAERNDCAAFLYTSHTKKRPHNLVLGRMFDGHVMDMVELGIEHLRSLGDIAGDKKALGSSPCMLFVGDEWDRSADLAKLRNLLLDVFAARDVAGITLSGLDHVLLVAARSGKVHIRGYHLSLLAAAGREPRVDLSAMGPDLDLVIRRMQHASPELEKVANRVPKELRSKKAKNVSTDELGEERGQLHMERQDFGKLQLRKTGAYKVRVRATEAEVEDAGAGDDDAVDDETYGGADVAPAAAGTKRRRD